MATSAIETSSELKRGAGVLLACTAGMMLGLSAIPFFTLSVFAGPVTAATGWSMGEFQFQFSCVSIGVLAAPFHGYLLDRYDARKVTLASIILLGLAVMAVGFVAAWGLMAFYATWLVAGLVGQSTGPVGWTKFVTSWFDRRRGIALGICMSGSGLFAFVGPPLLDRVIAEWGWQNAYVLLGAAILAINLPIAFVFLKSPPENTFSASGQAQEFSWTAVFSNYRFWLICAAFALLGFVVAGTISNLVPILELRDVPRAEAATLAGLVGFAVIAARVIVGFLLDQFWPPAIAAVTLGLPALSCLALMGSLDLPLMLAALLIGLSAGAEFDILAYLVSRYFQPEAYGRIYSITFMAMIAGAGIAPPLFGSNFDAFGNYDQILGLSAAIFLVAPLSLLALGRVPQHGSAHAS